MVIALENLMKLMTVQIINRLHGLVSTCIKLVLFASILSTMACEPDNDPVLQSDDSNFGNLDIVTAVVNLPIQYCSLLDNDNTDADSDKTLEIIATNNPSVGKISGFSASCVSYEPKSDYVGEDSFTYSVRRGEEESKDISVSIDVLSLRGVASKVALSGIRYLRRVSDTVSTNGLPNNEATQNQLDSDVKLFDGSFFVPSQLGYLSASIVASHKLQSTEANFSDGYSTSEMFSQLEVIADSLDRILAQFAYTDAQTGGKALYQVHRIPEGDAPRATPFEKKVSLLDNAYLVAGLSVVTEYLKGLGSSDGSALAARFTQIRSLFDFAMWHDGSNMRMGGEENPRSGVVLDRIVSEARLAVVLALAREEITTTEFISAIDRMIRNSSPFTTPNGLTIGALPFFGTALELWVPTAYLSSELSTDLGKNTLKPMVQAWQDTADRLGLPVGCSTGVSDGLDTPEFRVFSRSPAEVTAADYHNRAVVIPLACGMQAGAVGSSLSLQTLAKAYVVALEKNRFDDKYGFANSLDFGSSLVNEVNSVRGTLEVAQMTLALMNFLIGGDWLETLLRVNPQWGKALGYYTKLLNGEALEAKTTNFEAEDTSQTVGGELIGRSNASGETVFHLIEVGDEATYIVDIPSTGSHELVLRYSNDDTGAGDEVSIIVDGKKIASFNTIDTKPRGGGDGWNTFVETEAVALGDIPEGAFEFTLRLDSTDNFGVDLDLLSFSTFD